MSQASGVNSQIVDALRIVRDNTLTPEAAESSGAGKAYQSVSQSAAMAVQDATQNLRNISTISSTAIGVAMAQYLSTGKKEYKEALDQAMGIMTQAASDFRSIGENAAYIVNSFPSGSTANAQTVPGDGTAPGAPATGASGGQTPSTPAS